MPISNLAQLLKSMSPGLDADTYVFCTLTTDRYVALQNRPKMVFQETEGLTVIMEKRAAIREQLSFDTDWSLITMNVHSDLAAVGFLAALSTALAKEGISVNAVSAFYHDHLFVPAQKAQAALKVLRELSAGAK